MVAEVAAHAPAALPLICEPEYPDASAGRVAGWRRLWTIEDRVATRRWVRHQADDAQGAIVQRMVLAYYRDGVQRQQLAWSYGFSPRHVQSYLSGRSGFWTYSRPVLRALAALGLRVPGRVTREQRLAGITAASLGLLMDAVRLLGRDQRPEARRIVEAMHLLTVNVSEGR